METKWLTTLEKTKEIYQKDIYTNRIMKYQDCKFCQNLMKVFKEEGLPSWYLDDEARWQKFHESEIHARYEKEHFLESLNLRDKIKYRFNRVHGTSYDLKGGKK